MTDEERDDARQHVAPKRGRLKIFLGAVAGVGKTYKMLSEAHRRAMRGEDIVVGFVETHGRPATAALLEGFEQLPLKKIDYRGATFYELDTAAVIQRHPEWVMIDEIAHTNVPGTVHAKRWRSIEEIRDAGINVITTLNVQHIESLNDTVYELTGVRVRETVPDYIVDMADEIELVDLTPDALINRLKRGDIYHEDKIPQALNNFFRKGNIVALRELALQRTAEEVDEQLQQYARSRDAVQGKPVREHVVVCIAPRPMATRLVKRGCRIAKRMQGGLDCVFVRTPGLMLTKKEDEYLQDAYEIVRNFGGKVVELEGESVAEEIVQYVTAVGATVIVMGQSARSRLQEIVRGSIINRIMRDTANIDIIVVADAGPEETQA
jgi:two-component system sensor histidine kinase KdpD